MTKRVIFEGQSKQNAAPQRRERRKLFHCNDLNKAGDGTRTRDLQLGKLTLYQLSYSRNTKAPYTTPHENPHQRATEGD